jgi:soluble lytic murein transglycosylase-like protein
MVSKLTVAAVALVTLSGAASPVRAAVYEIADDGSVARIDIVPIAVSPTWPAAARRAPAQPPVKAGAGTAARARARAYQPLVAKAARQYEVSAALVDAIAHTESRYDQAAVSRTRAVGIMQLMPGTARDLGVDSRVAEANIRGGTAYLRFLLNRFDGNLICTIAAYNAGPGAVTRERCIPPYRETRAYVRAVLDRLASATD